MRGSVGWWLLLFLALLLIVAGIQGSLGRLLAAVLTPSQLTVTEKG